MPDYLNPSIPSNLERVAMPLVRADEVSLKGYGQLVDAPYEDFPIEIKRWPAQGWRPVDSDSGDEGGTVQGIFESEWRGDILYGRNEAVGGDYILGYSQEPSQSLDNHSDDPSRVLLWHCNYHPDGGQLFFPLDKRPFVVPLALPGDDVVPQDFVCFCFDGSQGLYIHPDIWHEGVFSVRGKQRFFDSQVPSMRGSLWILHANSTACSRRI